MASKYARKSGTREQKRRFVIAVEGEETEYAYFNELIDKQIGKNPRLQVEILPTIDGASSPVAVLQRLHEKINVGVYCPEDSFWIVIDKDKWQGKQLGTITRESRKKNYKIAMSYPCFELWLLLHLKDLSKLSAIEIPLLRGKRELKHEIAKIRKSLPHKENIGMHLFLNNNRLMIAIENAKKLNTATNANYILTSHGSSVYHLVEELLSFIDTEHYL